MDQRSLLNAVVEQLLDSHRSLNIDSAKEIASLMIQFNEDVKEENGRFYI